MDLKQIGLAVSGLGIAGIAFEYLGSFCSKRLFDLCFYPFSPSGPGEFLPLYSVAVLLFGLLIYFGSEGGKG